MQTLTKTHKILLGLLAVQIVLTIFVLVRGDDSTPTKEEPLLPGFDAAKVTRVKVFAASSADAPAIDLAKRGTSWVLASGYDFPADSTKIDALLTPIAKMAAAEPIASSAGRHKQLKVGDKDYERKLVLTADGKDVTVFVGASAGLRRNAVRLGGSDNVYAVSGVTPFLAATEARQWVKGTYVDVPREELTKVTIARDGTTIDLIKDQPPAPPAAGSGSAEPPVPPPATWKATIDGAAPTFGAGESLDTDAIDRVVNEVAAISVDTPADPKRDASKPSATITLTKKTGNPVVIDVIADNDKYWIHDKTSPQAVLVPKTSLSAAMELDKAKLTKKPPPPPAPEPGAGSGSAATAPKSPAAPAPKTPTPAPKTPAPAPKAPAPAPKAPAPAPKK